MKILITFSLLLFTAVSVRAQQLHFAYLQTDTHKPFYIILSKKNYSSTASGYIILPKLINGDYPVRIGFAKNEDAEQEYLLQVKDNDQGLLIKIFGDKGWGLFNLQTMAVQYAGTAAQERAKLAAAEKLATEERQRKIDGETAAVNTRRRNDSLKTIAAQQQYNDSLSAISAADDTRKKNEADSLNKVASASQQTSLKDSLANLRAVAAENERLEKIADSSARAQAAEKEKLKEIKTVAIQPEKKSQPVIPTEHVQNHPSDSGFHTQIPMMLQQTFTDSGWLYIYAVTNNGLREKVDVFLPARQPVAPAVPAVPVVSKDTIVTPIATTQDSALTLTNTTIQDTLVALQKTVSDTVKTNSAVIAGNVSVRQPATTDTLMQQTEKTILNSNCKAVATEKDFLNARKKLAAAEGTDNMITATRKLLKDKCYTTEQLRNLSVLFLTDADRYQFLDVAYPFTFDAYRYATLLDLLKDDYYQQRFKAMLH